MAKPARKEVILTLKRGIHCFFISRSYKTKTNQLIWAALSALERLSWMLQRLKGLVHGLAA